MDPEDRAGSVPVGSDNFAADQKVKPAILRDRARVENGSGAHELPRPVQHHHAVVARICHIQELIPANGNPLRPHEAAEWRRELHIRRVDNRIRQLGERAQIELLLASRKDGQRNDHDKNTRYGPRVIHGIRR